MLVEPALRRARSRAVGGGARPSRPAAVALAAALASLAAPGAASGEPAEAAEPGAPVERAQPEPPTAGRRALAVGAAIIPGVLVHGAGHYTLGESQAARRLLWIEAAGLGMIAAGGGVLAATGASRHYSAPSIGLLVSGIGLFGISWLADIWGASGAAGLGGAPERTRPSLELEAGYLHVFDPQFDYRSFATLAGEVALGAYRIAPRAEIAAGADNQRLRLEVARRLAGPRSRRPTGDGSQLELVLGLTHHRYGDDDFSTTTGEAVIAGRLDMARIAPTTAGSFAELAVGLAGEVIDYEPAGAGADLHEMLLTRFGVGAYLGRPGCAAWGEAMIYYDHRRDTLAGGISPGEGPGSGFAGSFGASALVRVGPRWAVRGELEQGAARLVRLALVGRFGEER